MCLEEELVDHLFVHCVMGLSRVQPSNVKDISLAERRRLTKRVLGI